jgi:hypothetical protein
MSDPVTAAKSAREMLSRALAALQSDPAVPQHLLAIAEPVSQAMSALFQIERSAGGSLPESGPAALDAVRRALALLQQQSTSHPAGQSALEAVAGSLSLVHGIASPAQPRTEQRPQQGGVAPQAAQQPSQAGYPGQPQAAPAAQVGYAAQSPSQAGYPGAAVQAGYPGAAVQAGYPDPAVQAGYPGAAVQAGYPGPAVQAGYPGPAVQQAGYPGPAPQAAHPASGWSSPHGAERPQPPVAYADTFLASGGGVPHEQSVRQQQPPVGPVDLARAVRVDAALGAHSNSNFYKGLSGNDVIEHGGIFVATYRVPSVGTHVALRIALPGGYEFDAVGVVRWTREPTDGEEPGFGAQLLQLTPEARQLVYRYVRNREPLFHDDA